MRILKNANFPFMEHRKKAYIFSITLTVLSLISFFTLGFQMGIDFKGGIEYVVKFNKDMDANEVRETLGRIDGEEAEVKTFGSNREMLIRLADTGKDKEVVDEQIAKTLKDKFPSASPSIEKSDVVTARFANDMQRAAIYAVLAALFVIFIYILIRYEWRFGVGAVVATFHDVIIVLGLFSVLHKFVPLNLQIDQTIIAAFLTIVGFSLNDTVIVFDRVRENMTLFKNESFQSLMNKAMNSTLSRTIITSLTVFLTALVLFILGGEVLRGFAFAMMVGIAFGTYSSVYVASGIALELRNRATAKSAAATKK